MALAFLFNDFILFSVLGWMYECVYCTVRTGHWQNRGFLFGPICPIYGVGALLILCASLYVSALPAGQVPLWQLGLLFAAGSAVLEYCVSWGLERLFHARWWDYSDMPLNLHGRICLPASVLFGLMGILVFRYVLPLINAVQPGLHPVLSEGIALGMMGLFGADIALSVASMSALLETLEGVENSINAKMEDKVQSARQIPMKVSHASEMARNAVSEKTVDTVLHAKNAAVYALQRRHLRNIQKFAQKGHARSADYLRRFLRGKERGK
ncbi:MAG: putative ABC transporter permease [Oscillibacter sp.]|nr:putative ABC transporter permease [Oscillibacter sp.]